MELARKLLLSLFPSRCLLCHKTIASLSESDNIEICLDCLSSLPYNECCCGRCAVPLVAEGDNTVLCGRCIKKAPVFDYVYSPLCYEGDVRRLVHQLKFKEKIAYSRSLSEIMLKNWVSKTEEKNSDEAFRKLDFLLPVPLYKSRMRQRGFNQSVELSRIISKKLNVPIEYEPINRVRSTESQTGLNITQRQKNIKGAFEVVKKISAKHVLIIDDVVTTGATVNELARVLKRNGVRRVGVLCLARSPIKN